MKWKATRSKSSETIKNSACHTKYSACLLVVLLCAERKQHALKMTLASRVYSIPAAHQDGQRLVSHPCGSECEYVAEAMLAMVLKLLEVVVEICRTEVMVWFVGGWMT